MGKREPKLGDDIVEGIEARGFRHRGRPAMALVLRLPNHPGRQGTVPFTLILVEDENGYPRSGTAMPYVVGQSQLENCGIQSTEGDDLAISWFDGGQAWTLLRQAEDSRTPNFKRYAKRVMARISKEVEAALPDCGFSPSFVRALRCAGRWPRVPALGMYGLFKPGSEGDEVRSMVMRHPLLTLLDFPMTVHLATLGAIDANALAPGFGPRRIERLHAPGWAKPGKPAFVAMGYLSEHRPLFDFVGKLPLDWMPTEPAQVNAMASVFLLSRGLLNYHASPAVLSGSCKADWVSFLDRCKTVPGIPKALDRWGSSRLIGYLEDPLQDFAFKVVLPVLVQSGVSFTSGTLMTNHLKAQCVALAVLYRDKSLPGCLEASRDWHAHLPALRAAMPSEGDAGEEEWPALFEDVVSDGIWIRHLRTSQEILDEGSRRTDADGVAGLDHCVASYRADARRSLTHIVSVRRRFRSGRFARLATVELHQRKDGRIRVAQIMGRSNGEPPEDARKAMDAFLAANPRLPYLNPSEPRSGAEVRDYCGYDPYDADAVRKACLAYATMLPRGLRTDYDSLAEAIRREWDIAVARTELPNP